MNCQILHSNCLVFACETREEFDTRSKANRGFNLHVPLKPSLRNDGKKKQQQNKIIDCTYYTIPLTLSDRSSLPVFSRAFLKTLTVASSTLRLFHVANIAIPLSTTR